MQLDKRKKYFRYAERLLLPVFFIAALLLCGLIEYSNGDDAYFYEMAHSMGLVDYVKMRYVDWEGRAASEAMTYIAFYFGKGFWQFINAAVLTLLPAGLIHIAKKINTELTPERSFYLAAASCVGILFLGIGVIGYGAFWITGSTFYLWSIVAGIWAVMPFVDLVFKAETLSRRTFIYALPCGLIAAMGQEQIAAVVIAFGAIAAVWAWIRDKRIPWLPLAEIVLMIAALIVLFLSPGTAARSQTEIDIWMPQFESMSTGNHVFITWQWILSSLANEGKMLFVIIWVTAIVLLVQKRKRPAGLGAAPLALASVCAVFTVGALLPYVNINLLTDMGMGVPDITKCVEQVATPSSASGWNWAAMLWWSGAFLFTLVLLFLIFETYCEKVTAVLLLLASAASAAIMYFSPTMYASGARVFFMTQILHWLLAILLYAKLEGNKKSVMLGVYAIAGLLNVVSGIPYIMSFL